MSLLIDEFTPNDYNDVFFHKNIFDKLKKMSNDNSIPHIIFHGPSGAGKKTMTKIFLRMIYGDTIDNLYTPTYNIPGSGNKIKKETIQNSDHHIIINPTGTNFDRYLVHEIIKKYASTKTLELTQNPNSKFRTIQISNLDKLSHSAQTSLRRMIEINASTCRFITWCDNLSNVIGPLKSRCVCIRVPRPEKSELMTFLLYISLKKKFNPDVKMLLKIVDYSYCNIKVAMWGLQHYIYNYDYKTNYDNAITKVVNLIYECDMQNIEMIRDILFNLMITNYNGVNILKDIENEFLNLPQLSDLCKLHIIMKIAEIEHYMIRCRRDIIHFDSMTSEIMKIITVHNKSTTKSTTKSNTKSAIRNNNYKLIQSRTK